MSYETYSRSSDFPNGIFVRKLVEEINASPNIAPTCTRVTNKSSAPDDVYIFFTSALNGAEKTALNAVVAAYVPTVPADPAAFGTELQYSVDDTTTSTTNPEYQTKLTMTTSDLPQGTYRLGFFSEINTDSFYVSPDIRILLNGVTSLTQRSDYYEYVNDWQDYSGAVYIPNISGVQTIAFQYRMTGLNSRYKGTVAVRNVTMELWRIS